MDGRELKLYDQRTQEAQFLRSENQFLRGDRDHYRKEWHFANERNNVLRERIEKVTAENKLLKQKVKELTLARQAPESDARTAAPLLKPAVKRRRKRPGRKEGHAAALRPMPDHIDSHQQVPLPRDPAGRESCPKCNACLLNVEDRDRVVEDIIPAKVVVKCYHTRSGWCPCCRKQVESRALEQPPAANIPHGQLGVNALATAMVLRIAHRLPFRQVTAVFANLPELSVSPGAIARQVQRIANWLDGDYEKLLLQLRCAPHVHADETGWRTDGKNGWLWAITSPDQTLYHVDKSRGSKVILKLLGKAFGGTLVSDFYSAYSKMPCKKQKCLVHLLRELSESARKSPEFAAGPFFREARRLVKQMLKLKKQWETLDDKQYFPRVACVEKRLEELARADCPEPNARRLARRMHKHQQELTAFLHDKDLAGTNNAAERAIRPAVVSRKISGASRSKAGADAWATLASLLRTAGQQGQNLLEFIKSMLIGAWGAENPASMPTGP
jgi:transposase